MAGNIRGHIAGLLRTSKRHTRYVGVLALLAVVVALGVTMGLRRNGRAATVEQTVLDCHAAAGVAHTHNADCYDADGNLVCPLQERELHVHDDSCYDEAGNLVCGKEEAAEEHVHGAGCFKTVTVTVDEAEAEEPAEEAEADEETADKAIMADYLTADGETVKVSVQYDEKAGIPEGSELVVTEVRNEDEGWGERSVRFAAALSKEYGNVTISDARFLSLAIMFDGQEINVQSPVTLVVEYADGLYTQNIDECRYDADDDTEPRAEPAEQASHFIAVQYDGGAYEALAASNTKAGDGIAKTTLTGAQVSDCDIAYVYEYETKPAR